MSVTENDEASPDADLNSQICEAAWEGDADRVKQLSLLGADVECFNEMGNTPLHLAIEQGEYDVVQVLLDLGADVNRRDQAGTWTPLIHATELLSQAAIQLSRRPDNRIIQLLLQRGADLTLRSSDGKTALDFAKELLNTDAERLLREASKHSDGVNLKKRQWD